MSDFAPGNIFSGSEALAVYENTEESSEPDCLSVERQCEKCLRRVGVQIPWAELFVVANSRYPQKYGLGKWSYSQRDAKMFPEVYHGCGCLVLIGFTPTMAQSVYKRGLDSGLISDEQKAIVRQLAAAIKQGQ